jgi:hypothetical protein
MEPDRAADGACQQHPDQHALRQQGGDPAAPVRRRAQCRIGRQNIGDQAEKPQHQAECQEGQGRRAAGHRGQDSGLRQDRQGQQPPHRHDIAERQDEQDAAGETDLAEGGDQPGRGLRHAQGAADLRQQRLRVEQIGDGDARYRRQNGDVSRGKVAGVRSGRYVTQTDRYVRNDSVKACAALIHGDVSSGGRRPRSGRRRFALSPRTCRRRRTGSAR